MSTSFTNFVPSSTSAFSFQPTLNGVQYIATIVWNTFGGKRYFLNLTDLSGNLILYISVTSSGPQITSNMTWSNSVATITTQLPHNVPIGSVCNARVLNTDSGYDGMFQMLATTANTLTYSLTTDPQQPSPTTGTLSFDVNLVGSKQLGLLLFHYETQQFEWA